MVDQRSFTVIVQALDADRDSPVCNGFPMVAVGQPVRLALVADPVMTASRDNLLDAVLAQVDAALPGSRQDCMGPGGSGCFAASTPAVRHVMVVVGGPAGPSADLEKLVDAWLRRGWEAIGVFRQDRNPDIVLPVTLRSWHALSWRSDVREVASDVVDTALLEADDRRVFISYAHGDGEATATRLADLLTHRRFDVFLDRFRLSPGVDFVERIMDELVDKAMVVVVETPAAHRSSWVRQEVATAVSRRLGLVAVNLGGGPRLSEIAEPARCCVDDDNQLAEFVVVQHSRQLRARRESLMQSAWQSLQVAGATGIRATAHGFLIDAPGRRYALTVRPRPADLRNWRLAHEGAAGADPVMVHPRHVRGDRRQDAGWVTGMSGIVDVDEGLIDRAARRIAMGTL